MGICAQTGRLAPCRYLFQRAVSVCVLGVVSTALAQEEEPVKVFAKVAPSVVELTSLMSDGTGIVLTEKGLVLTNAHVVVSPVPFRAKVDIEKNGRLESIEVDSRTIGVHPVKDMAIVQLDLSGHSGLKLRPAALLKRKASPGQRVYAIGNPGEAGVNLPKTITSGLLSGVDRKIEEVDYYQISAPINPGNSGGPLTDRHGNVTGLVTLEIP
jgi:S1-C subfamily serine protease